LADDWGALEHALKGKLQRAAQTADDARERLAARREFEQLRAGLSARSFGPEPGELAALRQAARRCSVDDAELSSLLADLASKPRPLAA